MHGECNWVQTRAHFARLIRDLFQRDSSSVMNDHFVVNLVKEPLEMSAMQCESISAHHQTNLG